jgi:hypothetical protein
MKTIRLSKNIIGFSAMLALAIGFTTSMFAGPGPQFWAQQAKNRADLAQKAEAAKPAATPAMACASCQTTDIREFHPEGAGGKVPARSDLVGTKHECAMCGGAITVVRGVTTNDMKGNCPTCAKAVPGCSAVKVAAN